MKKGTLHLFPCPISENTKHSIPEYVVSAMHKINFFIAERAKTARRFLKSIQHPVAINDIVIFELDKKDPLAYKEEWVMKLMEGKEIGILSEAGLPCIADPGEKLVGFAHQLGAEVKPYVGPSSIFLALIASGLNAENFSFRTYLPVKDADLSKALKKMNQEVQYHDTTQVFLETPYRNQKLYTKIIKEISANHFLCLASDLTGINEMIRTKTISEWRKIKDPGIQKVPTVFLIGKLSD